MRAGELRHPLRVEEPLVTQSADGAQVITWQTTVPLVWAQISPLRMTEKLIAAQQGGRETHHVVLRAPLVLPETYRLVMRSGRILEPTGVRNLDERGRTLDVMALEVTSGAT